jgi:hypothetical protein
MRRSGKFLSWFLSLHCSVPAACPGAEDNAQAERFELSVPAARRFFAVFSFTFGPILCKIDNVGKIGPCALQEAIL